MSVPADTLTSLEAVHAGLMAARRGDPLEETLARMLASWMLGKGALPDRLGLLESDFEAMMYKHFPSYDTTLFRASNGDMAAERVDEIADLHRLLDRHRTGLSISEKWMVDIVTAGCMGSDHLWQDLGLWCRDDLSRLMLENFKPLAQRNVKNMKWKKFLYKQLCETEGIYTCRSPSCEVCADYQQCFGPEE